MNISSEIESAAENLFSDCDAIILCGGLGTRLRPVIGENQKVLAPVQETPFLGILIDHLVSQGFIRFVFATGFEKETVRRFVEDHVRTRPEIAVKFSEEDFPLGTGGAVKKAFALVRGDWALVVNGDTFLSVNYPEFIFQHKKNGRALSLALAKSERDDAGIVSLDKNARLVSFQEKQVARMPGYINGGVYIMEKRIQTFFPREDVFSLEYDVFPQLVTAQECYGYITDSSLLDIGTPERYQGANKFFSQNQDA